VHKEGIDMRWIELGVELAMVTATRLRHGLPEGARRLVAQSTVEYALVGALVVIAAAGALTLLSGEVTTVFGNITSTLKTASAGH
jgi:Flp pilus assembly pilin Flp